MGNGSSCTKVEQFDASVQMPSTMEKRSPSTPSSYESPSKPPAALPLLEKGFSVKRNTDQYSSIWDYDAKLSSTFHQSLKAEFDKNEHHQKEIMNTKWAKKSSVNFDSTIVESTLSTETHSCINLSTSEKIDELLRNLNRIHTDLDDRIKRRTQQVSAETESVLAHIINETQKEQQRLLIYAKEQQTKQEEHYRQLLQDHIAQLDEMKADHLAQLQDELQDCRKQIMQVSQMKIMTVNEQANIIKSKIAKEEQQQATTKIDGVNVQLQGLSADETFQLLGTEITTATNVTTSASFGTKSVDQKCKFQMVEDFPASDINAEQRSSQVSTKTKYSEINNERHSNNELVITQLAKKAPIIPKLKVQESR